MKLPPGHPAENDFEHRRELARGLGRCDAELAALQKLHRRLRNVKNRILDGWGEGVLLDVGEGLIRFAKPSGEGEGDADSDCVTRAIVRVTYASGDDDNGGQAAAQEERPLDDPSLEPPVRSFLLLSRLRRRLLNRLARRLLRISRNMDGEDVSSPPPPKYGDLRFLVDSTKLKVFAEEVEARREARSRIRKRRDALRDEEISEMAERERKEKEEAESKVKKEREEAAEREAIYEAAMEEEEEKKAEQEKERYGEDFKGNDSTNVSDEEDGDDDDEEEKESSGGDADEGDKMDVDGEESSANGIAQAPTENGVSPMEVKKEGSSPDAPVSSSTERTFPDEAKVLVIDKIENELAEKDMVKDLSTAVEYEVGYDRLWPRLVPPLPEPAKSAETKKDDGDEAKEGASKQEEKDGIVRPDTAGSSGTANTAETEINARSSSGVVGPCPGTAGTNNTAATLNTSASIVAAQLGYLYALAEDEKIRSVSTKTGEGEEDEPDWSAIKYGAGVGAVHRTMSQREKELEWKRWQSDILNRACPEQPTFAELGMEFRVFGGEERRKRAREEEERKRKETEEKEKEDKMQETDPDEPGFKGVEKPAPVQRASSVGGKELRRPSVAAGKELRKKAQMDEDEDSDDERSDESDEGGSDDDESEVGSGAEDDAETPKTAKKDNDVYDSETGSGAKTVKDKWDSFKDEDDEESEKITYAGTKAVDEDDDQAKEETEGDTDNMDVYENETGKETGDDDADANSSSDGSDADDEDDNEDEGGTSVKAETKNEEDEDLAKADTRDENKDGKGDEEKMETKEDTKKSSALNPPKKRKLLSLSACPSFAEQDRRRILLLHADLLAHHIADHARRRVVEATEEYNAAFRKSSSLQDQRVRVQQELNRLMHKHRMEMNEKRNDRAIQLAVGRSEHSKKKERWLAGKAVRKTAALQAAGAQITDPTGVVARALGCAVDRVMAREETNPRNPPSGTERIRQHSARSAAKADAISAGVGEVLGHVVDAVCIRFDLTHHRPLNRGPWVDDRSGADPSLVDRAAFPEFVPPPASAEPADPVVDPATGETRSQYHKRLEDAVKQDFAKMSSRLARSEDDRKKAWKKLLKTKAEFEGPANHGGNYRRKGAQTAHQNAVAAAAAHLPAPPLKNQGRSGGRAAPAPASQYRRPTPATQLIPPGHITVPPPNAAALAHALGTSTSSTRRVHPSAPPGAAARASSNASSAGSSSAAAGASQSDSKYSAERIRARKYSDGSVRPATMPKRDKNGLYMRPAGRRRKGMDWDAVRGVWIPTDNPDPRFGE